MNYGSALVQTGAVGTAAGGMVGGAWSAVTALAVVVAVGSIYSLIRRSRVKP